MGLEINLQFTATSVEELKEQLKDALEALGGSVAQTPLEEKRWHQQSVGKPNKRRLRSHHFLTHLRKKKKHKRKEEGKRSTKVA